MQGSLVDLNYANATRLMKSLNEYIYSYQVFICFGNSSKLFVLAYTCILYGWRMLFTVNVLSAKSILASTYTATWDTENEAGALPAYQPQCTEYEWKSRGLPFH